MKKIKKTKSKKKILTWLFCLFCFFVALFSFDYEGFTKTKVTYQQNNTEESNLGNKPNANLDETTENNSNINSQGNLIKIHYIDVGQGDAIFIELPNEEVMLIDAGESSEEETVATYISNLGYSKIDYIVGTHPHTDHIGGLAYIINNFEVENIYMPKAISTSKTYENLLNTISQKGLKITTAKAGMSIISNENLNVDIIAPNQEYSDLNNNSAVIKISYGSRSFLFMSDAETQSENDILTDISADVIKVGHHGSDSSSSQSFVDKVNPEYAIIMVGTDNQYDHPHQSTVDRWINSGAKIYQTNINGDIVVTSDGNSLEIDSSR